LPNVRGSGTLSVAGAASLTSNVTLGSAAGHSITIGVGGSRLALGGSVLQGGSPLVFEGVSFDANKLTLTVDNPTAARTISLPDASGKIALVDPATGALSVAGSFL
jgi:hypothetical protein